MKRSQSIPCATCVRGQGVKKKSKKRLRHVVFPRGPHRSTDDARGSLTSEFGWDRVLYTRYGRNQN